MKLSVIIPAYNEEKFIGGCIESVLRYAPSNLLEILVVCNATTDRTAEVAQRYPKVRVVYEPQKGMGYVRQKGFLSMRGDVYVSLDADSRATDGWFETINKEFSADPHLTVLSGPYHFFDLPPWQDRLTFLWWTTLAMTENRRQKFSVVGGNFAARRSALERIGGFDTSIAFWGEDTNIGRRLSEVGKAKFSVDFCNLSSARRLKGEGFVVTGTRYAVNYISQAYLKRTAMTGYGERPWESTPVRRGLISSVKRLPSAVAAYGRSYISATK